MHIRVIFHIHASVLKIYITYQNSEIMVSSKKNAKFIVNIESLPFDISKLSEESKVIVFILMHTVNQSQEITSKYHKKSHQEITRNHIKRSQEIKSHHKKSHHITRDRSQR